jgi:CBS domain-containing protein
MVEKPTKTAWELVQRKKTGVLSVAPESTVFSALELMAQKNIGAVLVLQGEKLIGILSERDYARKVELRGKTAKDTRVREIMTEKVIHVTQQQTVDECRKLMGQKHIRHLPVVQGEKVIGMLSARDVLEEVLAEEEHLVHDLEQERLISTTDPGGAY